MHILQRINNHIINGWVCTKAAFYLRRRFGLFHRLLHIYQAGSSKTWRSDRVNQPGSCYLLWQMRRKPVWMCAQLPTATMQYLTQFSFPAAASLQQINRTESNWGLLVVSSYLFFLLALFPHWASSASQQHQIQAPALMLVSFITKPCSSSNQCIPHARSTSKDFSNLS